MSKKTNQENKKNVKIRGWMIASMIPVLLAVVEITLRISGYGVNPSLFLKHPVLKKYLMTNPYYFNLYTSGAGKNLIDEGRSLFTAEKPENVKRGFVLGGSGASGYPFASNYSFSKIAEESLNEGSQKFELINLGFQGVSSRVINDMAKKLLAYKPDFIVIYSGHDEYYGLMSETNSENPVMISLKNIRLCQLAMNLLNLKPADKRLSHTGPDSLYLGKKVQDDKDSMVSQRYLNQIRSIVNLYQSKKIPVLVIDPVSNLYDMPPFAGDDDTGLKGFINEYFNASRSGDLEKVNRLFSERGRDDKLNKNASVIYLDAVSRYLLKSNPSIDDFKKAKDLDRIPLRAKSEMIKNLRDYCTGQNKPENLYFMDLENFLTLTFGNSILSNILFMDHVNFNRVGQIFMGRILAEKIAALYGVSDTDKEKISGFYRNFYQVDKKNRFLPYYEVAAYLELEKIMSYSPFSDMMIPFAPKPAENNEITENPELFNMLEKNPFGAFEELINYYGISLNHYPKMLQYIESYEYLYPANPMAYLYYAKYYALMNSDAQVTEQLKKGYLLSGKSGYYKKIIVEFLDKNNKLELLKSII